MARESSSSGLVQKLLLQQQKLREMYAELNKPRHTEAECNREPSFKRPPIVGHEITRRSMHNWIIGSECDPAIDEQKYTEEEIEELRAFRKTNYSECHDQTGAIFPVIKYPPTVVDKSKYELPPEPKEDEERYYVENYCLNYCLNSGQFPARCKTLGSSSNDNELSHSKPLPSATPLRPKSRKGFDPSSVNSMGLSTHCYKPTNGCQTLPGGQKSGKSCLKQDNNS